MEYHTQLNIIRACAKTCGLFTCPSGNFFDAAFNHEFALVRDQTLQLHSQAWGGTTEWHAFVQYDAEMSLWDNCFVIQKYGDCFGNPGPFPGIHISKPSTTFNVLNSDNPRPSVSNHPSSTSTPQAARPIPQAGGLCHESSQPARNRPTNETLPALHRSPKSTSPGHHTSVTSPSEPAPTSTQIATPGSEDGQPAPQGDNLASIFSDTLVLDRNSFYIPRRSNRYHTILSGTEEGGVSVEGTFPSFYFRYDQAPHKPFALDFELLGDAKLASVNGKPILTSSVPREIAHELLKKYTGLPFHTLPDLARVTRERWP